MKIRKVNIRKFVTATALLMIGTVAAFAADVTGKWTGQMSGPDGGGGMSITFTFRQEGTRLTGTVEGPQGPMEISDGKADGDRFSFTINAGGMMIAHEGTVKGDEITLTVKMDGGPGGPITLKRVK